MESEDPCSPPRRSPSPPSTRNTRGSCIYYSYLYSTRALDYYNDHHQDKFELVVPLCFKTFYTDEPQFSHLHLGFIAKSLYSLEYKLFFGDFSRNDKLITCTIVEPGNPFYENGCIRCHHASPIYHPYQYQPTQLSPWELEGRFPRLDPYEESANQLLRESFTINSNIQELDTEDANELKETIDGYVLKALTRYNHENCSSFIPLETVCSVRFRRNGYSREGIFWVHLIFKAKNIDSTPINLFAELSLDSDFITCVAVSNTDAGSSFPGGETSSDSYCRHCPLHPEAVHADCRKGFFADCLWNGRCWAVKSKLQMKGDQASRIAWLEHQEQMQRKASFF